MSQRQPVTREDLSTVLAQSTAGQTVKLDDATLRDMFGGAAVSADEADPVLHTATRFAIEHNCEFGRDRAGRGIFTKAPTPTHGSR